MANKGICRSCGADILWSVTPQDKRVPIDAKPEKRYILTPVTRDEFGNQTQGERALVVDTYMPHFATCPDAEKWHGKGSH